MTVENWLGLGGLAITVLACAVTWGTFKQKVEDLERRHAEDRDHLKDLREADLKITEQAMTQLRGEVGTAQETARTALEAASEVKGLGAAVDHLATSLSAEIRHMTEMFGLKTQQLTDRHDGLAHDLKNMRQAVDAMGRRTRPRKAPTP